MPGPISIIHLALESPLNMDDPFRKYAMASRYGWPEMARKAAEDTLSLEIHFDTLPQSLDVDALKKLLKLRYKRVATFSEQLNDIHGQFSLGNSGMHGNHQSCDRTWPMLKMKMDLEMHRRPSGITILNGDFLKWPETVAFRDAKCGALNCLSEATLYGLECTREAIVRCIESLPKSLD